jgi:YVTN family beta-propeller protein
MSIQQIKNLIKKLGLGERTIGIIGVVLLGALLFSTIVFAHGGDASLIHSCVKTSNHQIRIVGPNDTCGHNETPLDWNIQGLPGPTGPTGPQGIPGPQGPIGPQGEQGTSGSSSDLTRTTVNLDCVATLRWWDTTKCGMRGDFTVGSGPTALIYAGGYIWVANSTDGTVTALYLKDGSTFVTTVVGANPVALAYDGSAFIWVVNQGDNSVSLLDVSNGNSVGTPYSVGSGPRGIAFDGVHMWITNGNDNTVTVLDASNGNLVATYPTGPGPKGIAFDGAYMWIANSGSNTVSVLDANNGSALAPVTVDTAPNSLAFDGTYMWVAHSSCGCVRVMRRVTSSASVVRSLSGFGTSLAGIAFDGREIWVTVNSPNPGIIQAITFGTGLSIVGYRSFHVGTAPQGLAFDGVNLWAANSASGTVSKR